MDILYYIAALAVVFWAGIHWAQIRFLSNIAKHPEKFIKMLEQIKIINDNEELGLPDDAVEVRIEKDKDVVYAYEKVSGQFLAQAQSLHLAMVEATKRYYTTLFLCCQLDRPT